MFVRRKLNEPALEELIRAAVGLDLKAIGVARRKSVRDPGT